MLRALICEQTNNIVILSGSFEIDKVIPFLKYDIEADRRNKERADWLRRRNNLNQTGTSPTQILETHQIFAVQSGSCSTPDSTALRPGKELEITCRCHPQVKITLRFYSFVKLDSLRSSQTLVSVMTHNAQETGESGLGFHPHSLAAISGSNIRRPPGGEDAKVHAPYFSSSSYSLPSSPVGTQHQHPSLWSPSPSFCLLRRPIQEPSRRRLRWISTMRP
jgi:hypothetical protein